MNYAPTFLSYTSPNKLGSLIRFDEHKWQTLDYEMVSNLAKWLLCGLFLQDLTTSVYSETSLVLWWEQNAHVQS